MVKTLDLVPKTSAKLVFMIYMLQGLIDSHGSHMSVDMKGDNKPETKKKKKPPFK